MCIQDVSTIFQDCTEWPHEASVHASVRPVRKLQRFNEIVNVALSQLQRQAFTYVYLYQSQCHKLEDIYARNIIIFGTGIIQDRFPTKLKPSEILMKG